MTSVTLCTYSLIHLHFHCSTQQIIQLHCLVYFAEQWCKIDIFLFGRFGGEEQQEENRVHLGNAIMSFYSALIDLLGRCAPEMHVSKTVLF